jgi:hypothetical protein
LSDTPPEASSILKDSRKILRLQVWIVGENLLLIYTCRQPPQDIPDSNAEAPDAGLARPLPSLDCDSLVHGSLTKMIPLVSHDRPF